MGSGRIGYTAEAMMKFLSNKRYRTSFLARRGYYNFLGDEEYLRLLYWARMGKKLNLEQPRTYCEKLQWLKLHDRRPEYTMMVDKYAVRKLVAEKVGAEHLIPLLGIWDTPDEIDFDALPEQFVLKCTHTSGLGLCICKDKSSFDIKQAKNELWKGLRQDYYLHGREWPYQGVRRRIIGEEYIADESINGLNDYKFLCFDGKPEVMLIVSGRPHDTRVDFFDLDFKPLPISLCYPNSIRKHEKPAGFEQMKDIARILSNGIPHVRVDMYDIRGKVYFGELTFFQCSGLIPHVPEEWEHHFGNCIRLPEIS